ncbi:MAG TPA: DUF4252 domain-containing protein [Thermoanaerobaculia bacterium]|nr:DUF4252 domain-containing protein [Thermoanaerobaculia bacterium]
MKAVLRLTLILALTPAVYAQRINLDFPGLADKAREVVDVTLDGALLRLGARFLSDHDADERAVRQMVDRLEGIYVRSYEFDRDDAYDRSAIDAVRKQLGPNWKRVVTVRSKLRENVEIYTELRGENIVGLVVIAAEPRELTIVNLVGPIDLDKLANLEGQFGIPRVSKKGERP